MTVDSCQHVFVVKRTHWQCKPEGQWHLSHSIRERLSHIVERTEDSSPDDPSCLIALVGEKCLKTNWYLGYYKINHQHSSPIKYYIITYVLRNVILGRLYQKTIMETLQSNRSIYHWLPSNNVWWWNACGLEFPHFFQSLFLSEFNSSSLHLTWPINIDTHPHNL